MPRKVKIVPPETYTGIKRTKVKTKAAGIPGIWNAFRHINEEVGFVDGLRILNKLNKKQGVDCPGCAWPDPDGKRSMLAEYCENGAKAIAEEATKKRVTHEFFRTHSVEELSQWSDYEIGKAGRITEPVVLHEGSSHYEPISWDDAFALIASELNALPSPNEAVFYTSGRTSNEAAFMYQLFVREFGTNNMPDCSNMCHESSGVALNETLGIGKGTVTLEDIHHAELILVIGQNPGTNHPRMLSALAACKRHGGTIISVNPLAEAGLHRFVNPQNPLEIIKGGIELADHFLQVRINGDVPFLKGVMRLLLDKEEKAPGTVFDHQFIREKTTGYETFLAELKKVNAAEMAAECGLSLAQLQTTADLVAAKKKIIVCWAMGLTQHKNAVDNIREIVNLLLLRGAVGIPGAGACPVRGHSNVQGDRTMGIYEKPSAAFLDRLENHFGFKAPRDHGYDTVDSILAMNEGRVKVFIALGGNFISATPDSEFTGKAMQKVGLTVQISTKLNRSHLVTGSRALILPCLSRTEEDVQQSGPQFVSVENSMGVVHSSEGQMKPASVHLKSEPAIVAAMARAVLGDRSKADWEAMTANYDVVRNHIEKVIPGFDHFNEQVRKPEGFYLPNGPREGRFTTGAGKAVFTVNEFEPLSLSSDQYIMMTIRSHDQFNTTIYGLDDRYRGIKHERRVILMNEQDMKEAGLREEQEVNLYSHFEGEVREALRFLVIPYSIPRRCTATYFPETNALVPVRSVALKSNTPASKSVIITIKPA